MALYNVSWLDTTSVMANGYDELKELQVNSKK